MVLLILCNYTLFFDNEKERCPPTVDFIQLYMVLLVGRCSKRETAVTLRKDGWK